MSNAFIAIDKANIKLWHNISCVRYRKIAWVNARLWSSTELIANVESIKTKFDFWVIKNLMWNFFEDIVDDISDETNEHNSLGRSTFTMTLQRRLFVVDNNNNKSNKYNAEDGDTRNKNTNNLFLSPYEYQNKMKNRS